MENEQETLNGNIEFLEWLLPNSWKYDQPKAYKKLNDEIKLAKSYSIKLKIQNFLNEE